MKSNTRCSVLALFGFLTVGIASAQQFKDANWKIGLNAGLSYNMLGFGFQVIDPVVGGSFHPFRGVDGTGISPLFGLFTEYNSKSFWGAQLRVSYDTRSGAVEDRFYEVTRKLDVSASYLSIEPLFRLNLGDTPGAHFVVGPLVGLKLGNKFKYTEPVREESVVASPELSGLTYGLTAGFGFDIAISKKSRGKQWFLTPWLDASWMGRQRVHNESFNLDQGSYDDIWSTVSVRAGLRASLGIFDRQILSPDENASLLFSLLAPTSVVEKRTIETYFPLLPYVFFEPGDASIPIRYSSLSKIDASNFKEESLFDPNTVVAASSPEQKNRQAQVYYHILNIYGDRLRANPQAKVQLIGSDPNSNDEQSMALSVRSYLIDNWGIDSTRISVQTQDLPRFPSGTATTAPEFKPMLDVDNRRVEIITDPPLNQLVRVKMVQDKPVENEMTINIGDNVSVKSWTVDISGEGGYQKRFGPFEEAESYVNAHEILGSLQDGEYTAVAKIETTDGKMMEAEQDFELVKRETNKEGQRVSLLFKYGEDNIEKNLESFMATVVAPKIANGSRVYIHGHTDNIGRPAGNMKLSQQRARVARTILRRELDKRGIKAAIQTVGFGQDETYSILPNSNPEGRHYNRSVVVEIIPIE